MLLKKFKSLFMKNPKNLTIKPNENKGIVKKKIFYNHKE